MNNLHSIPTNGDLNTLLKFYQKQYSFVTTRIENNIIQIYNHNKNIWQDVSKEDIDLLAKRWKENGSPTYT